MDPLLWYLECFVIITTSLAALFAFLLIRAARRPLDTPYKPPRSLPSTPLTRHTRERTRVITLV